MFKIADKVLISGGIEGACAGEVVRITPKGFIVVRRFGTKNKYTFRPDGTERTSDKWRRRFITQLTEKDLQLLEMKEMRIKAGKAYERIKTMLTKEQCEAILLWKEAAGV